MQQNSVLFKRSSFFIDAVNVLFYTDLFLYHELLERMKESEFLSTIFGDNFPVYQTETPNELDRIIIKLSAAKKNQNILLDWVSAEKYKTSGIDMSMEEYLPFLFYDMLTNPICEEYMQLTEFGNTMRLLSKDRQLNHMDIYIPFESEVLKTAISESFSGVTGDVLSIVIGGKEAHLKNHRYDSYIFERASDVDAYLTTTSPVSATSLKEVILPTYEFNMEETRTELDILVEQVTYHKLNLRLPSNAYQQDYGLSINTIAVPI